MARRSGKGSSIQRRTALKGFENMIVGCQPGVRWMECPEKIVYGIINMKRQEAYGQAFLRTLSLIRWICPRPSAFTSQPSSK